MSVDTVVIKSSLSTCPLVVRDPSRIADGQLSLAQGEDDGGSCAPAPNEVMISSSYGDCSHAAFQFSVVFILPLLVIRMRLRECFAAQFISRHVSGAIKTEIEISDNKRIFRSKPAMNF
jgi:hypothetical protein